MENYYLKSQNSFISRTMLTMALGLLITFLTAIAVPVFIPEISLGMFYFAGIIELIMVFMLARNIKKLSLTAATTWFYIYAIVNGFTLSVILTVYGYGQGALAFLLTSLMFFSSSMIGITTKKDLSTMGRVLMMGVVGLILIGLVQIIFPGSLDGSNMLIALLGIGIFCGLTAYDMQKVKYFHQQSYAVSSDDAAKFMIIAALELYLDFINIFIYVLRLLNSKR